MKYLRILDWAALFAGAANTMVLLVVCLMIWTYQSRAAELGARLPSLLGMAAALAGFTLIAAVAVHAVRRQSSWHWLAQAALLAAALGLAHLTRQLG